MKWDEKSVLPIGRLKGNALGKVGDAEAEIAVCLVNNELDDHDVPFSEEMLQEARSLETGVAHCELPNRLKREVKRLFDLR